MKSQDLDFVCKMVRQDSAIVLDASKEYLVESRLTPVARKQGFDSVDALVLAKIVAHLVGDDRHLRRVTVTQANGFIDAAVTHP